MTEGYAQSNLVNVLSGKELKVSIGEVGRFFLSVINTYMRLCFKIYKYYSYQVQP